MLVQTPKFDWFTDLIDKDLTENKYKFTSKCKAHEKDLPDLLVIITDISFSGTFYFPLLNMS